MTATAGNQNGNAERRKAGVASNERPDVDNLCASSCYARISSQELTFQFRLFFVLQVIEHLILNNYSLN